MQSKPNKKKSGDSEEENNDKFILVPAHLFTQDQMAKIGEKNG